MIVYNVTVNIEDDVHNEWLAWMREIHIPEVLKTGLFVEHKMLRILSKLEGETGTTYSIQYTLKNIEDYNRYREEFAPQLQQKTQLKFGGKFLAFRTLLEVL